MKPSPLFQEKPQIFAYLRRSTKKEEQEMSLEKQLDSIPFILEEMGLSMADITKSFSDSFTGYKIKTIEGRPQVKRPGFRELVKTVREQKVPCIILAFNPSRLTRNVPDGTTIKEFLGHHENKQKVQYIRFFGGVVWDKNTPATTIDAEVSKAVAYSERLAQDKINNILTSLKSNRLPATIKTPPGLKAAREGLLETEKMPFIHRAFEMKANGETGESIEKYLKQNNSYIKAGNLKKYFSNSIYIGKYFYERNEVEYEVKFVKKKVAIPMELWNQVQHRLGKKGSGYGEFQENDVLRKVIKIRGDDGEVIGGMTGYE